MPDITSFSASGLLTALLGLVLTALLAPLGRRHAYHATLYGVLFLCGAIGLAASLTAMVGHLTYALSFGSGMELSVTPLRAFFLALVSGATLVTSVFAPAYYAKYQTRVSARAATSLTALFVLSMLLTVMATTVLTFLVSWEVMSFVSFLLVGLRHDAAAGNAAVWYLAMTHVGVGMLIVGFACLTGGDLSTPLASLTGVALAREPWLLATGTILVTLGFAAKMGLAPLHVWVTRAYSETPAVVSALFSGAMAKVALCAFLLVSYPLLAEFPPGFAFALAVLGLLTAAYGVMVASVERDTKRTIAWSSIENMGLIVAVIASSLLTLGTAREFLYALSLFLALNHTIFKVGLFLVSGVLTHLTDTRSLDRLGGLARRMPLFSFLFLVLCLAGAALPPAGTFVAELAVFQSAYEQVQGADTLTVVLFSLMLMTFAFTAGMAAFTFCKLFGLSQLGAARTRDAANAEKPPRLQHLAVGLTTLVTVLLALASPTLLSILSGLTGKVGAYVEIELSIPLGAALHPAAMLALIVGGILVAFLLRRLLSRASLERSYHTWDCGQPIDASMEYTATAFTAPVRFFFSSITLVRKSVTSKARLPTNPYLRDHRFSMAQRALVSEALYLPLIRLLTTLSAKLRLLQSGFAQWYVALIFLALVVSLLFAS